jgi:energy-coupling factor transport system substrate-specific component
MKNRLTLSEIVFITVLASGLGIFWWAYSLAYAIIAPPLKAFGLSGLLEGLWQMGGIFFAYIIRKPGSAILGETIAAAIEGMISQWGFTAIIYGLVQGLGAEATFAVGAYKHWNRWLCALAGAVAATGGYIITYYFYAYTAFTLYYNLLNLGSNILSGALIGGLVSRYLANQMYKSGVLNQFNISRT